ncbi:TRI15 protein, partial [Halcyon senegalensis]|nr:TRI15 protein [Halcyon senegalensis]
LRQQEDLLLAQLDRTHGELAEQRREYLSRVSERRSLLDTLIAEIEKKRDQPVVDPSPCCFPGSCEAAKVPMPEPVSPELQRTVQNLCETSRRVVDEVAKFKGEAEMWRAVPGCVTLDPETASPDLILSKDLKALWLADRQQNLPDTPKRFTGSPSVLGSQGFSAG